ncbi:hypothetical protein CTAYLR_006793 [Chrysophaeum taylorii]|uniref:Uncharacterized protein n=1 Tax=Chrysophaeum taylorii TaxID=2483200 RepID=A0AAD7U6S6_9STRA|nr:hypothetical protein CTAYLR_006793 [Chrysophaeum taylorii]
MNIDSYSFYDNYSGHPVGALKAVVDGLRQSKDSLIYLVGDSSLDNKYWFGYQERAVNGYETLLQPAFSRCDVAHHVNRELATRDPSRACVNAAVEASSLNGRSMGFLQEHDCLVRDTIRPEDVLVVSVGGNDIALTPVLCTCFNVVPLLCFGACCGSLIDRCTCACPPDVYTPLCGYSDCGCCCCGLPGCLVGLCGFPPGLGYFVDLFGNRVRSYVSRIVAKTKPKLVVICMIYFLDVHGRGSWADATLSLLGYNCAPHLLQKAIRTVFEYGTKRISIPGTKVLPFALYDVIDGTDTNDFVQRVEPSVQGGSKMAAALVDAILNAEAVAAAAQEGGR